MEGCEVGEFEWVFVYYEGVGVRFVDGDDGG